jgi:hypothetical protein
VTSKKGSPQARLAITGARWKAASALYCATILRPDLDQIARRNLANAILSLGGNQHRTMPKKYISAAVVEEIFFRQAQCVCAKCPMLLFSEQLAEELNAYFEQKSQNLDLGPG